MLEDDPVGAEKRFSEGCPSGVGPRKDCSHIVVRSEGTQAACSWVYPGRC